MNNLPDFMIIGVPRSGTSSLFMNLAEHPKIQRPRGTGLKRKELNFFTNPRKHAKGVQWYSTLFPKKKPGHLTFEASTSCVLYPERVRRVLPNVKAILLIRNPTVRAWGYFWIRYHTKYDSQPVRALLDENHRAVTFGIYIDLIRKWCSYFPKKNLLILKSEDWFSSPRKILKQVYEFLGIEEIYPNEILLADPWTDAKKKYGYPPIPSHVKKWLDDFYRPYNKRLSKYLNRDLKWEE